MPALSVSCLTASTKESRPTQTPTQPDDLNRFRDHQPEFRDPRSTQYSALGTQYPATQCSGELEAKRSGKPAAHNQPPHARNPEGASAEASTLSGFSLLPQLQDPEGPGLPVKARYHLSVVPALSVSCLTASTKESRPTQTPTQPDDLICFRDHQPEFRDPRRTQYSATRYSVPSNAVIWQETRSEAIRETGRTQPAPTREKPRGSVRRSIHPLGALNRNQLAPTPVSVTRRLRNFSPDRSPYRRLALPQTEVWFRGHTLTEPKPG